MGQDQLVAAVLGGGDFQSIAAHDPTCVGGGYRPEVESPSPSGRLGDGDGSVAVPVRHVGDDEFSRSVDGGGHLVIKGGLYGG